ncbi:MAG: IreB family regulatory phosphoprotein [Eubacteriales bacterium]
MKDNSSSSSSNNNATKTRMFSIKEQEEIAMRQTLQSVYNSLKEKGYNPVNQIVGYILSEDPTYITNHNNARALIRKIDRDELLRSLVQNYLKL